MGQPRSLRNFTVGAIDVSPQHNHAALSCPLDHCAAQGYGGFVLPRPAQTRVVGNEELLQAVWQEPRSYPSLGAKSINALRTA